MKLLQSQKNRVYDLIEKEGLSPNMFCFEESAPSTKICLKSSDYYFILTEDNFDRPSVKYSPGENRFDEGYFYAPAWGDQIDYIEAWLQNLAREINEPDKWKLLQEELENINFSDIKYENIKFTYQEYELLESKTNELKEKIGKLNLLEKQLKQINNKLDHLLNLAKDMNKTDWKELFIGSIISLIMQLSVDKTTGQAIFALVRGLFIKFLPIN